MNRDQIIKRFRENQNIPVLIIGAGINGIGTFRDLALNGVDVLLVDKGDYCSGASAASSHMAHGGIRYLENGEFRLVHEAVQERNRMIENAPHRVIPLPTTIPMFKVWSGLLNAPLKFFNLLDRPAERGAIVIKIGLMIYDSYTRKQKTVPGHQFHNRQESLERYPELSSKVKYTATYFDGLILSPERYSIDLIKDAIGEHENAMALNYAAFEGVEGNTVKIKDALTGEELRVSPKVIVNAAGPWIDGVNRGMGVNERYIGGTKGSHLVLDVPELRETIGDHEFFFENKDGRIVLILPFYDKVVVGTSDIPAEDADHVVCTDVEVDYFLELVDRIFPNIKIPREAIVFKFAGIRPLEYSKAKTTGQISRDHSIKHDKLGDIPVLSLVGGKWTSYRAFSEQTTDELLQLLGETRQQSTENIKIDGGANYPRSEQEKEAFTSGISHKYHISCEYAGALFLRYGTGSGEIAQQIAQISPLTLNSIENWSEGEVRWLIRNEGVEHLDDLFLRRTTIAWLGMLTREVLLEFADIFADEKQLSTQQKEAEIRRTIQIMDEKHGVKIDL